MGFTAAGTTASRADDREYHYGATPQALLALRLAWRDRVMLEARGNDYLFAWGGGSAGGLSGTENLVAARASLTVRISGPHAISVEYAQSVWDPRFDDVGSLQSVGAFSISYTWLGGDTFGIVR